MKLIVILKPGYVADVHNLRHRLLEYGIDFTDLIALAIDSYNTPNADPYLWEYDLVLSALDPRHKVNRLFEKGRISVGEYVRINGWVCDAIAPLRQEISRILDPVIQTRFYDVAEVAYRFRGYLHRCDGLAVEITPRTP